MHPKNPYLLALPKMFQEPLPKALDLHLSARLCLGVCILVELLCAGIRADNLLGEALVHELSNSK